MACLVSISFSTPLCAPKPLIQRIHPWRSASGGLVFPATGRTAVKFLATNCSGRGIVSVNRSHQCRIMTPSGHFRELVSHYFNVSSSAHRVISGFWVGPDIEDGWGFVEAFVNRIY